MRGWGCCSCLARCARVRGLQAEPARHGWTSSAGPRCARTPARQLCHPSAPPHRQRPTAADALRHPFLSGGREGAADRGAGRPLDKQVVQRIQVGAPSALWGGACCCCLRRAASRVRPAARRLSRPTLGPPSGLQPWRHPATTPLHPPTPPPAALCPVLAVQAHGAGAHCRRPAGHALLPRPLHPRRLGRAPACLPACAACN